MNKDLTVELHKGLVRWFYRIKSSNGSILSHSKKYYSKSNAKRAAKTFAKKLGSKYKEIR